LPETCKIYNESDWKAKSKTETNCGLCEYRFDQTLGKIIGQHHCRRCGIAICSTCGSIEARLSKVDPNQYRVCDKCDFELSNPVLIDVDNQIKEKTEKTLAKINYEIGVYDMEIS